MYTGKSYTVREFLCWTRRSIYWPVLIAFVAVALYEWLEWKFVTIPWTVLALLGTTAAFIVGFKNVQTYNRTWEARQIWGSIVSSSRGWGIICRGIKQFPFPRQYATINTIFVRLFSFLLPFGLLNEFDKLNESVGGMMQGKMTWLVIPFSVLIVWIFSSLEQVGESTENPFEGGANDVPISQMSRSIEIELKEMLGENEPPPTLKATNNILL